eukprot:3195388-Prymnesium_polylepis.1
MASLAPLSAGVPRLGLNGLNVERLVPKRFRTILLQLLSAAVYSFPAAAAAVCSWLQLSCSWRLVLAAGGWFLRLAA